MLVLHETRIGSHLKKPSMQARWIESCSAGLDGSPITKHRSRFLVLFQTPLRYIYERSRANVHESCALLRRENNVMLGLRRRNGK